MTTNARKYWIGIASHDHVQAAVSGGFCQLGHGKEAPVLRLRRGDLIVFYSSRERMGEGPALQSFTAIGRILDDAPVETTQSEGFRPFRRKVQYFKSQQAPIRPLLDELSFTRGRTNWGMAFRRASFIIASGASVITSKPATCDQCKTGHLSRFRLDCFTPRHPMSARCGEECRCV
jgi:hypothetical protein